MKDSCGTTPLMDAASGNHNDVLKYLINEGVRTFIYYKMSKCVCYFCITSFLYDFSFVIATLNFILYFLIYMHTVYLFILKKITFLLVTCRILTISYDLLIKLYSFQLFFSLLKKSVILATKPESY